jgi:hypothetical protein
MRLIGLAVVLAVSLILAPLAGEAQQAAKVPLIGYVGNSSPSLEPRLLGAFREGLRNLGYVEGQNIRIEYRWAEGRYERFPDFMAELVRLKVDVIVVAGTPATLAAKRATNAIPIVMAVIGDALEADPPPPHQNPASTPERPVEFAAVSFFHGGLQFLPSSTGERASPVISRSLAGIARWQPACCRESGWNSNRGSARAVVRRSRRRTPSSSATGFSAISIVVGLVF